MKVRRSILALGAFFVLGAGIAACGSGVPGDSVADVAGNPITTQAFNHWMYVIAKGQAGSSSGAPLVVATGPPQFTSCISQIRRQVPTLAKQTSEQLRATCKQLFKSESGQVLDLLIRSYWFQAYAAKHHVKVSLNARAR